MRARSAAAYMKDVAPFLGLTTPVRRALDREVLKGTAVGWSLREYAETDPDAVRAFVAGAQDRLSPLSRREALKHL